MCAEMEDVTEGIPALSTMLAEDEALEAVAEETEGDLLSRSQSFASPQGAPSQLGLCLLCFTGPALACCALCCQDLCMDISLLNLPCHRVDAPFTGPALACRALCCQDLCEDCSFLTFLVTVFMYPNKFI